LLGALAAAGGCAYGALTGKSAPASSGSEEADRYRLVDCLLPGQVRRLGMMTTYVSRPELIETAARECEIRGGEYIVNDPGRS
jgi:hypothetical protein